METGLQTVNQQRKLSELAECGSTCRNSGLTAKIWCRENGISEQTYSQWHRCYHCRDRAAVGKVFLSDFTCAEKGYIC